MIRAETSADYEIISNIASEAFGQDKEAKLVEALRELPGFDPELSLIAELNGSPVGHLLLFPVDIVNDGGDSHKVLSLCPMAVLPEYQRKGIGSNLVREALERSKKTPYSGVIVQCNGDYYPRFGFLPAGIFGIKFPRSVPPGTFLAIETGDGSLSGCSGTVKYPDPFGI
jgi:putative acetyltransferase